MDKIKKFLKKLSKKDLNRVLVIVEKIERKDLSGLDVKKLAGHKDIFRVRAGGIRVIFVNNGEMIRIVSIERRNEKTYKF